MVKINNRRSRSYCDDGTLDKILAVIVSVAFYIVLSDRWFWDAEIDSSYGKNCAANKGVVVVNLLGPLPMNILEIAFARRMAEELCWEITYRTMWAVGYGGFPETDECFSNLLSYSRPLQPEIMEDLGITDEIWQALNHRSDMISPGDEEKNSIVKDWAKEKGEDGKVWLCVKPNCQYSEDHIQKVLAKVRDPSSAIRVLYLEDFFVHSDWMLDYIPAIQRYSYIDEGNCCSQILSDDETVIHLPPQTTFGDPRPDLGADVYYTAIKNIRARARAETAKTVTIVTDKESKDLAKAIKTKLKKADIEVKTVIPKTSADRLCILKQAETLILMPDDLDGQLAALLGNVVKVHNFMVTATASPLTMFFGTWKYHLVTPTEIVRWDKEHPKLEFQDPWYT